MDERIRNLLKLQTLEFSETTDDNADALIAELRDLIPPQILGHYDRLRARNKRGLAMVQNQVCTGCHMRLPLGVIMTLKHGEDMQLCDNCGRYLYLADESPTTPAAKPQGAKPVRTSRRKKNVNPVEPVIMSEVPPPATTQVRLSPE